jgi:hypothetical protein
MFPSIVHGHDMETTVKHLRHAVALNKGRRRAYVHGQPVGIRGKGGVVQKQHRTPADTLGRDVL